MSTTFANTQQCSRAATRQAARVFRAANGLRAVARATGAASSSLFAGVSVPVSAGGARGVSRGAVQKVFALKDGAPIDGRKLRVAIIGGGPAGACAAETLAKGGVEAFLIERKMDNCKPCGGAIPLCMVEEFNLPMEIIDRKVTKMKMISPSNREVDVGKTLSDTEWIGMCRREVFDDYLRKRAVGVGAKIMNGLFMRMERQGADGPFTIHYNSYEDGAKMGAPASFEVRTVSSILRANALRSTASKSVNVSFGSKGNEERVATAV
ncbi:Geranylgeranyl diphosphate reductase, chloroplastic [Tetrabaena socialis]|uniref:Geranylgeranyl diphosphate reductase, chloroplastic n=1 Tax=Tetrabaena socialis TaxID=47790 RepID=A0A2J7ZQG6_9CHLO|nr:Geranylgeranyl diphosphate reductase, chloroplastic [Tetrabaena socialis]|eukprot:PNH02502.1 Geranylgeranyl diphosphate reductase, chloroplastic [Tetrabaena socialis]